MKRLSQFKSYIDEGKGAIFIGAGISKIAGCEGLKDIVDKLNRIKSIQEEITRFKGGSMSCKEFFQICKTRCDENQEFRKEFDALRGLV